MYRKDAAQALSADERRKRSQLPEDLPASSMRGVLPGAAEPSMRGGAATRAALATVGGQSFPNFTTTAGSLSAQRSGSSHHRQRDRDSLPQLSAADPENVSCSNLGVASTVNSTAAPSEASASAASSRRSSSRSEPLTNPRHSGSSFAAMYGCPPPPPDVLAMSPKQQPARSQSVGGMSSRSNSRPSTAPGETPDRALLSEAGSRTASGSRTPQPGRQRGAANEAITPEMNSRAPSGSRTPTGLPGADRSSKGQAAAPLTNAQLERASQKLQNFEKDERPPSAQAVRPGWDKDEKGTASEPTSPTSPASPSGPRDSKQGRRPVRQFSDTAESTRPSSSSSRRPENSSAQASSSSASTPAKPIKPKASTYEGGDSSKSKGTQNGARGSRASLKGGSRDDSFLSTISESTRSTDSTSTDRDSKINVLDGSQIEVYSENKDPERGTNLYVDVLKNFQQLFRNSASKEAEQMQHLLRNHGFDKPLETQRRIIPLIMSAFQDEQKSFITVQGAPQCGKTSALALGILGAVGQDMPGIRAIALSTGPIRDFKGCFDICSEVHPIRLICFEGSKRRVSFEGVDPDPESNMSGMNLNEDMQRLSDSLSSGQPGMIFGHPSRVLPVLREAPSWGVDISNVQVLALDDAEEAICQGLIDEVCEVCTILRHFSKQRLRHIILSHFLSNEAKSMVRCLRTSLLRQQNLFGIRAHRTQARAKAVEHYYAVAPRSRWPAMLAVLHHALSLPSGIIFDDESADARAHTRVALRALGVTASVWNALQEQRSGARAAARDSQATTQKGPAFHLMPSDLVVLKVDLPQVRCVLHFEVPRRELSIYGLRLMCLEQQEAKKASSRKPSEKHRSLSVLFVEEAEVVRELEKTFHIRMHEVPTEMLPN